VKEFIFVNYGNLIKIC